MSETSRRLKTVSDTVCETLCADVKLRGYARRNARDKFGVAEDDAKSMHLCQRKLVHLDVVTKLVGTVNKSETDIVHFWGCVDRRGWRCLTFICVIFVGTGIQAQVVIHIAFQQTMVETVADHETTAIVVAIKDACQGRVCRLDRKVEKLANINVQSHEFAYR